ncbi:hypothetical protein ABT026_03380 [Streptomyces sp. NPDC002734]|uniref:hypothetical protein n=1 Tax=Streptomyces sp. NPDC002734 TaxID=3154426 RepID=UPI00332D65E7
MNSLKGFGILAAFGGLIYVMSKADRLDRLVLVVTVAVVAGSLLLWAAAVRRARQDRRAARGPGRGVSRRAARG